MLRSFLALTALAGITAGLAQADYIIIKVNMAVAPPSAVPLGQPVPPGGVMQPGVRPGGPVDPAAKPGEPPAPPSDALTTVVFFEYTKPEPVRGVQLPPGMVIVRVAHKWGQSYILNDSKFIQLIPDPAKEKPIIRPTVLQAFENKKKDVIYGKDKSAAKHLDLAEFALQHGLLKQCAEMMEETAKIETKDPDVLAVLKAFDKVNKDLAQPVSRDDAAIVWKDEFRSKVDRSEHYCLLSDTIGPAEVKGRLARLENNMKAFYYWFALRGKALPVPDRRLVALVLEKPIEYTQTHRACAAPAEVADGFFSRRDNLLVFSANRLDAVVEPLNRHFNALMRDGWDLKGAVNLKTWKQPRGKNFQPQEAAHANMMGLIKRALEEESEIATTSHQGSRQLLAAIGMLPRGVEIPEWVQFGWPAFFETPKFDPITHTGAFWAGTGAPSWVYMVQWKLWEQDKSLAEPVDALLGVLTDSYFREANQSREPELLLKARAYAWAFTYYLSKRQLDGLIRYGQALNQLPRDLEFDGSVHLNAFARSFGLLDAGGAINQEKLEALARDWYKFMAIEPLPMPELFQEAQRVMKERKAAKP